jgi:hypothetical protein
MTEMIEETKTQNPDSFSKYGLIKENSNAVETFSEFLKQTEQIFLSQFSNSEWNFDELSFRKPKFLITEVEKNLRNLQKIQHKPEIRNELITNEAILSYLQDNLNKTEDVKGLIKIFQKKLSEMKIMISSDFKNSNHTHDSKFSENNLEISKSAIFIFENLSTENESSIFRKENFYYLILILPMDQIAYFFTFDQKTLLNYQQINSFLTNNKIDFLKTMFDLNLESYIEEKNFNFEINLKKLYEDVSKFETLNISSLINEKSRSMNSKGNQDSFELFKELNTTITLKAILLNRYNNSNTLVNVMKEKFSECRIYTNDVKGLKNYYESNVSMKINSNTECVINKLF